jgi:hypothetical protein
MDAGAVSDAHRLGVTDFDIFDAGHASQNNKRQY